MKLPTVTIDTKAGPVIINKSDFDKDIHTLYVEKKRKTKKKTAK